MQWQDIAISIAQWAAVAALVPSIFSKDKPALSSSLLTCACVATFMVSYLTLGLIVSGISAASLLLAWVILAYQQWRIVRARKADTM
ncbi:MAG: hypothetical protein AAB927_04450 [Patescibacteria group bacterium]